MPSRSISLFRCRSKTEGRKLIKKSMDIDIQTSL